MMDIILLLVTLIGIAAFIVLMIAARKPDTFHVQRSVAINMSADKVLPLISNLRSMNAWNPFARGHPTSGISYSGPDAGPGAAYVWDLPGRAGAGRIEIADVRSNSIVDMDLTMRRPIVCTNKVRFTIEPLGNASKVTWAMTGPWPYLHRVMGTIFSMDKMVGGEFEKGLRDLKATAEL
jgi:Polyketide cyclase / dehydrase and lipid transport